MNVTNNNELFCNGCLSQFQLQLQFISSFIVRKLYQETGKNVCIVPITHKCPVFFHIFKYLWRLVEVASHFLQEKFVIVYIEWLFELRLARMYIKQKEIANSYLLSQYVRFKFVDTPIWTGVRLLALIISKNQIILKRRVK